MLRISAKTWQYGARRCLSPRTSALTVSTASFSGAPLVKLSSLTEKIMSDGDCGKLLLPGNTGRPVRFNFPQTPGRG